MAHDCDQRTHDKQTDQRYLCSSRPHLCAVYAKRSKNNYSYFTLCAVAYSFIRIQRLVVYSRFWSFVRSSEATGPPSVLWYCWLGGRKGIRPVKKLESLGAGVVICLERGADLHTAQLMPLPLTVSCSSKTQIGFTFLVPAHLGI